MEIVSQYTDTVFPYSLLYYGDTAWWILWAQRSIPSQKASTALVALAVYLTSPWGAIDFFFSSLYSVMVVYGSCLKEITMCQGSTNQKGEW
jgi:hypothetical protein